MRTILRMALIAAVLLVFPLVGEAGCSAPTTFSPTIDPNPGGTTITYGGATNCTATNGFNNVQLEVRIHRETSWGWSVMDTLSKQQALPNITLSGSIQCITGTRQYWVKSQVWWSDNSGSYTLTSQSIRTITCPTP